MTITEPIDDKNLHDILTCPRCGTSLPAHTKFCSSCGRRIKKINEEGEARTENDHENGQGQEVDDTVRLPSLSRAHSRGLQSGSSLRSNGIAGKAYNSRSLHQNVEAPISEELTAPSLPVPDMNTKKQGAIPLSQQWEQQITKPLSIVHVVRQQIVGMLRSHSGSSRRGDTLIESTKDVVGKKLTSDETLRFPVESYNNSMATASLSKTWGLLPILSLVNAVGVFLVALAYEGGRLAAQWSELVFWFGLLVIFIPIALRLFSSSPTRRERIALLIVLAISLYFVKFLQYPIYFGGYDEFLDWRAALDIVASGHLFQQNPLLPISAFYPGLEIVTSALSSLTGLSLFASGIVLIGVVQLVFVLALYLLFEQFTNSTRAAGIATVLYMANANFLFFDMDFSYESLALPLAMFVLFAVARRSYAPAEHRMGLTLVIGFGLGAVVITHHVTSYALVAFLLLWTAVLLLQRTVAFFRQSPSQKNQMRPGPGGAALLGLVLSIGWLIYTGDIAVGYLTPHFDNTVHQLTQILAGQSAPRQLFQNLSGFVVPLWERMLSYASVALILLGLPFGIYRIWQHRRASAAALALVGTALAYPASQALRLTPAGGETGNRATEFVFLGIAFVLAIGATEFWFSRTPNWRRSAMLMGAVGVICFGQMALGSGQPWSLLPGPYLVSADSRSIEPQGITAAKWANSYLGPGRRIASDRINALLMGTYGDEQVVTAGNGNIPVAQVFTSLYFRFGVTAILQQDRIQYLIVDRRLSTSLPYVGTYFNLPASGGQRITTPIDPAALAKFDGVQNVSRIFDSGDIVIYDVEAITNGSSTNSTPIPGPSSTPTSTSRSLCTPASLTAASPSYPKVGEHYTGTIDDIPTGLATNISLTGIQQQQGSICGYFTGIPASGPFKGTITADGQIQFILTSGTAQATFSFEGLILPNGVLAGTYCSPVVGTGQCSDYGLWSVSPA